VGARSRKRRPVASVSHGFRGVLFVWLLNSNGKESGMGKNEKKKKRRRRPAVKLRTVSFCIEESKAELLDRCTAARFVNRSQALEKAVDLLLEMFGT